MRASKDASQLRQKQMIAEHSGKSQEEVSRDIERDKILTAEQAVDYGLIDAVLESDVNILDIAALAVIVREAGAVFSELDGTPLTLDTRSVLAAVPALHDELRARLA